MRSLSRSVLSVCLLAVAACGIVDGSTDGDGSKNTSTGPQPAGSSSSGGDPASAVTYLDGLWSVSGTDTRGAYHGQAEIRSIDGKIEFIRTITYDDVKVEDGRSLYWTFVGDAKGTPKELTVSVTLDNRGFIAQRGSLVRTLADAPIAVSGKITLVDGEANATYTGAGVDGTETWTNPKPAGLPIFQALRLVEPGHDAPDATTKGLLWSAYGSFRDLPAVKPYVERPEFQAAIHGHIFDRTDFDFYRANPNALHVVNKSVDPISLQEALARANAYRKKLADKAAGFDTEIQSEFTDPTTGMLLDAAPDGQPKPVHISAALWTGIYVASQVYRYEVTGHPQAKANAVKALDGMLKLQEVTGDWTQFARAIRPATGNLTDGWHGGAGALSSLEWLEGGNNDMLKGVYIAHLMGWRLLCKTGSDPLCARIHTNAKHLADDINVDRGADDLDSPWLVSVVTTDPIEKLDYQGKATVAWGKNKIAIENNTTLYTQGTADWSGLNLGFVGHAFHQLLADEWDIAGDAKATFRDVITKVYQNLKKQRLPLWNFLGATYSTGSADSSATEDALWRMREMPFPKPTHIVDRRISPEFCMSPYPSLPWKNDWTTTDRTQALRSAPLFEEAMDIYRFRTEMGYHGDSTARPPAPEYLIAYWFARKHELIGPTE